MNKNEIMSRASKIVGKASFQLTFCDWIESLLYSELITGKGNSAPENSYCSGRR